MRTAQQLFDMLNATRQQGFQRGADAAPGGPGGFQSAADGYQAAGGSQASSGFPAPGGPQAGGSPASGGFYASDGFQAAGGAPAAGGFQPGPGQAPQGGSQAPQGGPGNQAAQGGPGNAQPGAGDQQAGGFGPNNLSYGPNEHAYQPPAGSASDGSYNNYNVEGSDRVLRRGRRNNRDGFNIWDVEADDIGGVIAGAALGWAGRKFGKKMMQAFEERVVPAMQARMEQAMQQAGTQAGGAQQGDQDAIVARYPELRGCLADQVVFLDGGVRTVPVSELTLPVTLTQADAVVARLR